MTADRDIGKTSLLVDASHVAALPRMWALPPPHALERFDFCFDSVPLGSPPQFKGPIDCSREDRYPKPSTLAFGGASAGPTSMAVKTGRESVEKGPRGSAAERQGRGPS